MVVDDVGGFDWSRPAAGGYPIKNPTTFGRVKSILNML
jgi:hypothetical protein